MLTAPDEHALAELLPGTWRVVASNFPMWLGEDRLDPTFSYGLLGTEPLRLSDDVAYTTPGGDVKHIVGVDQWRGNGFVWRGKGLLKIARSRWAISGTNDDQTVVAIRFEKTLFTPAGIDILVREAVEIDELRSLVARNTEQFGLSAEDFASLTWLD